MPNAIIHAGKFVAVWGVAASPWILLWSVFSNFGGWPNNDDPFYAKPLFFWSHEGVWKWVKQDGELTASSIAHQVVGGLAAIGGEISYRSLFLICIIQQGFGVASLYCTSRAFGLTANAAGLIAATLGLFPLYFGHAFTFMTDGPATAWAAVACCCSALGIVRSDWRWLLVASCAIGWGFWIRQTNGLLILAPFLAWLILLLLPRKPNQRVRWAVMIALLTPSALAFGLLESGWLVESSISRFQDVAPTKSSDYSKETVIAAYGGMLLIGWYMLPWMLLAVRAAIAQAKELNATTHCLCIASATLTLFAGATPLILSAGNACLTNSTGTFIQNAHFGPIFLSDMDEPGRWSQLGGVAWPLVIWKVLSCAAVASSAVVAWWFAWTICMFVGKLRCEQVDSQTHYLAAAVGLLATALVAAAMLIFFVEPHMDRYWLIVLAVLAVWWMMVVALQPTSQEVSYRTLKGAPIAIGWAVVCVMSSAGISTLFTHDMLAWNNARWQYINSQLASGMPAYAIDGGRDVNAWLRLDEDTNSTPRAGDTSLWWSGRATRSLAVAGRPGWHEIDRLSWSAWATGRVHYLLVLERDQLNVSKETLSVKP